MMRLHIPEPQRAPFHRGLSPAATRIRDVANDRIEELARHFWGKPKERPSGFQRGREQGPQDPASAQGEAAAARGGGMSEIGLDDLIEDWAAVKAQQRKLSRQPAETSVTNSTSRTRP